MAYALLGEWKDLSNISFLLGGGNAGNYFNEYL